MFFKSEYHLTIKAVKKSLPAVVGILITKHLSKLEEEIGKNFIKGISLYGYLEKANLIDENGMVKISGCSGFFVTSDGYILTNRHVVEDEESSYTVLWQDKSFSSKVIIRDKITDIAILKVEGTNFPYLEFGNSKKLQLGQTVVAIGNALGEFQNTVSRGIISGLSRSLKTTAEDGEQEFYGLIQTDAAINPGNSGGPLIDLKGKAIGINTAVVLGVENIGFAIPINQAKKILFDFKKYGKIRRPSLGIRYYLIDKESQLEHHLPFSYGAFIIYETIPGKGGIIKNGPAEKAGLKEGDIILEIENQKITTNLRIAEILDQFKIGDKIKVCYWRQGQMKETNLELRD
ncbi:MAG TPA: trypsin-like peptidase domain-containing protein [Candidatus Paceibacterota bacterium]|nr:trypsin-like peptidase domain-containing protein [Candidatus Paceibacterota bacterium]